MNQQQDKNIEVILGNSNPRFSGVTSTMLQTLEVQKSLMPLRVMGKYHLPDPTYSLSFWETATLCKKPLATGKARIFHARRNDEMIQALLLKKLLGARIKILFTSTAQRHHSKFTKWLIAQMDSVISTCHAAANYLERPPNIIVPHGIQTDRYYPAKNLSEIRESLNLKGKYTIGILGRVRKQKGVHHFVDACIAQLPNFPDFNAVIVGKITPENTAFVNEQKTKIRAANLDSRIEFLGEQPFAKLPEFFRSMSLVAALSENEGFGLTPLEAMASGVAVLTTKAGAWPEIIENGIQGYCVDNTLENISGKLGEMLADHKKLIEMGQQGRQLVLKKYTIEREARALCDHYKTMQEQ